ncbi:MAG: Asp-tRNA(Asn)/Glu-tRNA(Gln) amidotransferase subunit GatC [Gemmatimonadaceae bacterium]|nr:Asp-tRNA(Asn)/Glu-tRNA(Gln) amidotransferase subunit GatC [Gemmatimonadaceae bacterium]
MSVTLKDVQHIAELARLSVDEAEAAGLVEQLNDILSHMDALSAVNTKGVTPASGVGSGGTPLRQDSGRAVPLQNPISAFAPEFKDGFFLVPRLATHEPAEGGA